MAQYAAFSLHVGIGVEAEQREKLERLDTMGAWPLEAALRRDIR